MKIDEEKITQLLFLGPVTGLGLSRFFASFLRGWGSN